MTRLADATRTATAPTTTAAHVLCRTSLASTRQRLGDDASPVNQGTHPARCHLDTARERSHGDEVTRALRRLLVPVVATVVVAVAVSTSCAHYCAAGKARSSATPASHCAKHDPKSNPDGDCCKSRLTGVSVDKEALATQPIAVELVPTAGAVVPPPVASTWTPVVAALDRPPPSGTLVLQHTSLQR